MGAEHIIVMISRSIHDIPYYCVIPCIYPTYKSEICTVCEGVEVLNDVEIPGGNGLTCELFVFSFASLEASPDQCVGAQLIAQSICCPSPPPSPLASPCKFCDGREVLNDVEIPGLDGATCGLVAVGAMTFEETSEECIGLALVELACCAEEAVSTSSPTLESPSSDVSESSGVTAVPLSSVVALATTVAVVVIA